MIFVQQLVSVTVTQSNNLSPIGSTYSRAVNQVGGRLAAFPRRRWSSGESIQIMKLA